MSAARARGAVARIGLLALLALMVSGEGPRRPAEATAAAGDNLLANPGFEQRAGGLPRGWVLEERVKRKGEVSVVRDPVHGGQWALRLRPGADNTRDILALNVGQGFAVAPLGGKRLRLAGWMTASPDATAVLSLRVVDRAGGVLRSVRLAKPAAAAPSFTFNEGMLEVPADPAAVAVVVSCQVEGTSGAAFFDDVSLVVAPGEGPARAGLAGEAGASLRAEVEVDAGQAVREIPRTLYGHNLQWIYGGNMIIDFRTGAFSQELIRLTRDLGVTLLRFPGGSFADFYNWRDGVGPASSRRETQHQPGDARSRHTFGTDEALAFAETTGARLLITVNAHTGTPQEAADWVRYVNGRGASRRVVHWEVGNEFYIKNDDPANATIPPREYVGRLLAFARAIRQADPGAKILAIGGENFERYDSNHYPGWNREVLARAGGEIDYLAVHNAYFPLMFEDRGEDVRTAYAAMLAAPLLIKANLETLSRQIETYAPSRAAHIKLAVTEWGPIFHLDVTSRWLDHVKTLGSGLFVASTLKAFIEAPRLEIANAFKLNEPGFMGWIQPRNSAHLTQPPADGQYLPTAPYYALQMFTRHFGSVLVRSSAASPTYDSQAVGMVGAVRGVPYLEAVSSRSADGRTLYLMAINKHFDRPITARIRLSGFTPKGTGRAWTLRGTGIDANTGTKLLREGRWTRQVEAQPHPRFYQGKPGEVSIVSSPLAGVAAEFEYAFPPHSVTSLELLGAGVPVGDASRAAR